MIEIKDFVKVNQVPKVNIKNNLNNKIFLFINIFLKNRKIKIIVKKIKSIFGIKNFSFIMKLIKNNFVKSKLDTWIRSEEDVENEKMMFKSLLKKEFEESIYSLSKITGRNLTSWLKS